MARDVTTFRDNFGATKLFLGISVEQLILFLYPAFLIPVAYFWYTDIRRRRLSVTTPQDCVKLGMDGPSQLDNQYDEKYDKGTSDISKWKVKAIHIHPIKSCSGIELNTTNVDIHGLVWDRQFAFAELLKPTKQANQPEPDPIWTFRTLRTPGLEKLALIKPEVWISKKQDSDNQGTLVIKYPNESTGLLASLDRLMISIGFLPKMNAFAVPLVPPKNHKYPLESVNVWKDTPTWLNYGVHVPDGFRHWLGAKRPLTLFRADPYSMRKVFRNAPREEQVGYQPAVGFQDAYPLNLINITSVHNVADRLKESIPQLSTRRFRSNLLLEGPPAYDEDDWKKIKIGKHEIYCACRTVRCRLPNVDPDTAERHPVEPDKTLKSFRCIDDGDSKNACLGLQLVPATGSVFTISVGDTVEVLERGEHHYIPQGQ